MRRMISAIVIMASFSLAAAFPIAENGKAKCVIVHPDRIEAWNRGRYPNLMVLELKKYEALIAMSNGRAAKIIVPTDAVNAVKANVLFSETTGLGDITRSAPEEPKPQKEDPCCDDNNLDEENKEETE